ncbi:MAG: hypothetical protein SFV15_05670 [Polyangiaceae bacterium]|nr:hypothetical protein [Polyangiaceae bacterium]
MTFSIHTATHSTFSNARPSYAPVISRIPVARAHSRSSFTASPSAQLGDSLPAGKVVHSGTQRAPFGLARVLLLLGLLLGGLPACEGKPSEKSVPVSAELKAPEAPARTSEKFIVDVPTSKANFLMDAPLEKIYGEANQAIMGDLFVDLKDLSKSSGLLRVDLLKLEVFQQKREDEKGQFGERVKNDKQNEHMRTWFEISDDVPPMVREKNRFIEFKLTQVTPSVPDVTALQGDTRTFTATVTADLRLHQRTVSRKTKLEVTVLYAGGKPTSLKVKSLEPLMVNLEAHDVVPRSAFEKLASKSLAALGPKVAAEAPVLVEFTAKAP